MRLLPVLTLLVLAGGCGTDPAPAAAGSGAEASPGAEPTLGADQEVVDVASAEALIDDVAQLDAEVVVLNFWATWCGPCRIEFPEFVRFGEEMQDEGVAVRFVSLDDPGAHAAVKAFLAEHAVSTPSYFYSGSGDLTSQLNPLVGGALPITMVLNGDGIVQDTHVGVMSYDELAASVEAVRAGTLPS